MVLSRIKKVPSANAVLEPLKSSISRTFKGSSASAGTCTESTYRTFKSSSKVPAERLLKNNFWFYLAPFFESVTVPY